MADIKDVARTGGLLVGLAALTAVGLAGAYLVTRDRTTLRHVVRLAAGSLERVSAALAEAREEIEDLWAEGRDEARQQLDEAAFAAAEPAEAEPAAPELGPSAQPVKQANEGASRAPRSRRRPTAGGSRGKVSP